MLEIIQSIITVEMGLSFGMKIPYFPKLEVNSLADAFAKKTIEDALDPIRNILEPIRNTRHLFEELGEMQ